MKTKKNSPTLHPFYVDKNCLKGLKNIKPNTFPAEPIDPEQLVSKSLVQEVPRKLWEGDWLINLNDDIKFLEQHFCCGVGDYLYIREPHRLTVKTNVTDPNFKEVWVEYVDLEKRKTSLLPEEVKYPDRNMPPITMPKLACRYILKVRSIGVMWADDKKTRLVWVIGIERMPSAEYVLELEKRNAL